MAGPHPSHKTRISMGASSYDEICENCGATDQVPGGWGALAYPCPNPEPDEAEQPIDKKRWAALNASGEDV